MKKMKPRKILCLALTAFLLAFSAGCVDGNVKETEEIKTETEEKEPEEKRVSFFGAGDNLIHNCVYWQAEKNVSGGGYDFKPMYRYLADDISNADIAYINQETILGGTEMGLSSYPLFNSPQEVGRDMIELGFDVFSQATNHSYDKGEKGLENTYNFYQNNSSAVCVGLYKRGDETIKYVEKNGIKIAFLNYTYTTNGLSVSPDSEYYVATADYENNCAEMAAAVKRADENADFVVCFLHWGDENQTSPNEIQRRSAEILSAAGCDAIIGTHPHAIEPIEYVNDTLVVYSLGNFISAQVNPVNLIGGTVTFDFCVKGDEKKIENVHFRPVVNHFGAHFSDITIIPFDEYSPELAAKHGSAVSYEYFDNLIKETISPEFLN